MKKLTITISIIALLAGAAGVGYWWGTNHAAQPTAKQAAKPIKPERKLLYYRNPMGLPDTSPVPKKDSMNMDYLPVYEEEAPAATKLDKGKILYYRNPMGEPDTSPVPKKDSMDMDYIPVYESEAAQGNQLNISVEKIQKLGVKSEAAALRELGRSIRAVGKVEVDERRLHTVAPKFEGWIQQLHVNATGQTVLRGQALMEVYSPDLVSAQQEYTTAEKGAISLQHGYADAQSGIRQLADSALLRLRNWDISETQLQRLRQTGIVRRTLTLSSPASGVVLEKVAVQGMRFMPGEVLYRIADLSSVWLLAEIFEQDLAMVRAGQTADITVNAYPGKVFKGKVAFIYPMLNPQTRTAQVRIDLPNPGGLLIPAMYAKVELAAARDKTKVVSVPISAVLNNGARQVVLVELGGGRYEPRSVKLGMQSDQYVQVLEGLNAGEKVVTSANFLIDAESNLKAALSGFSGQDMATPAAPAAQK